MKCITLWGHARKGAVAAILGSLFCLAGCENGPSADAMAPPKDTAGLAKTNEPATKTTASGDEYNELMRKQQAERQKKGSNYSGK